MIENYAFLRLRQLHGNDALHFWRTADGKEIDFIISKEYSQGEALEIKFDQASFAASKYNRFTNAYPTYPLSCRAFKTESRQGLLLAL